MPHSTLKTGKSEISHSMLKSGSFEGKEIVLSLSIQIDDGRSSMTEQSVLSVDGEAIFHKSLKKVGNDWQAIVQSGRDLLDLSWTSRPDGDSVHVSGKQSIGGGEAEDFDEQLSQHGFEQTRREANSAANSDRSEDSEQERLERALSAFARELKKDRFKTLGDPQQCTIECTQEAALCAVACAALSGAAFPICAKGCVVYQTYCIAKCASEIG